MLSPKQTLHEKAVKALRYKLSSMGIRHRASPLAGNSHPELTYYDLLIAGKIRCEVKAAEPRIMKKTDILPCWRFNLHRHGKLNNRELEVYAFYCAQKGASPGFWLIMPPTEVKGIKTVKMSIRSIAMRWGKWLNRYDLLRAERTT